MRLAGTVGTVNDGLPVRLASYSLIWDAYQAFHGYLREGRTFVKTRYREALVAPGGRWVAGVPDRRLWRATEKIDLIDRGTGRTHAVRMPAPVTSPEWSADGGTLLLTAYRKHRDGALTVIGFVTLDARDRVPRLVRTGPPASGGGLGDRPRLPLLLRRPRTGDGPARPQGRGRRLRHGRLGGNASTRASARSTNGRR
ncbi:hypothetical protein ACFSTC_47530 [Nonomuraea ferruginea]